MTGSAAMARNPARFEKCPPKVEALEPDSMSMMLAPQVVAR
jgi:hypothetical protein